MKVHKPTANGIAPAIEERLLAFNVDPEEFSDRVRKNREGTRSQRARAMQALALAPGDVVSTNLLDQAALRYENNQFIADDVCPVQLTSERSASYLLWSRTPGRSLVDTRASARGEVKQIAAEIANGTYTVVDHALAEAVPMLTQNANPTLGLQTGAVERVMEMLMVARENRVATMFNATGNYAAANVQALAGARKWNGGGSATPTADMLTAIESVRGQVRAAIMTDIVWHAVQQNAELKAILASQLDNKGLLRPMDFGLYFGIENVIITKGEYEDSAGARKRLWSEANLILVNSEPARDMRTFARTFRYRQGAGGFITKTWIDDKIGAHGSLFAKVTHSETDVIVANDYAAIITGVKQ